MDWRAGHLTTTEGTGGWAFANKNYPQGRAFENFFSNVRGMPGGLPGGMLAAGIDSHITTSRIIGACIEIRGLSLLRSF